MSFIFSFCLSTRDSVDVYLKIEMKKLPLCQGWLRLTKGGYLLDLRDATMVWKVLRSELTLLKNFDKGNDCFDHRYLFDD